MLPRISKKKLANSIYNEPSDEVLRARGYMTTDEFVDTLIPGLRQHMSASWRWAGEDSLHHPADLASSASGYTESVYSVIETFGVQPYKKDGVL
jgi:hypothetical protein